MTTPNESPQPLPKWWDLWPGRLEWELRYFEHLQIPHDVVEDPRTGASRLVIEATAQVEEGPTRVKVVYPDSYPNRQFEIYAAHLTDLRRHRSPVGALCLFPDNQWTTQCSAANAVAVDVPNLVQTTRAGGQHLTDAEVPQGEPLSAYHGTPLQGSIVVDERVTALAPSNGDSGTLTVGQRTGDTDWLIPPDNQIRVGSAYLLTLQDATGADVLSPPTEVISERYPHLIRGRWVYLADPPYSTEPVDLRDAAIAASPDTRLWSTAEHDIHLLAVGYPEEIRQGVFETGWTFIVEKRVTFRQRAQTRRPGNNKGRPPQPQQPGGPFFVPGLRYTDDSLGTRIPALAPMRSKTVALIGLGSLGAPLAFELAKARIGQLRIADRDNMEPGNLVRHPLGLSTAGIDKPIATYFALQDHNPEVDVVPIIVSIGNAPPDTPDITEIDRLTEALTGADLMISATAEHSVNTHLDALARSLNIPRLYLWSMSGYGGVVALLRGGETACYTCLRDYESQQAEAGTPFVAVPDNEQTRLVQPAGCASPTFTAPHPDLLPISNEAVRMAFGYLCGPEGGYPAYDADLLSVQTLGPTGNPVPPTWKTHTLPPNSDCPMCTGS